MYPRYFFIPNSHLVPKMSPLFSGRNIGSLFSGIKHFNWKNLLNGAGKTLNVIERTIPIVKETKPIVNNVRSILKLSKAFNKETNNIVRVNKTEAKDCKIDDSITKNSNITFFA